MVQELYNYYNTQPLSEYTTKILLLQHTTEKETIGFRTLQGTLVRILTVTTPKNTTSSHYPQ